MKILLRYIFLIFTLMVILHFIANFTGLYETSIVWIDKVLHILAGIGIAMIWIVISERKKVRATLENTVFGTLLFVLIIAIFWELTEFLLLKFLPFYALSLNIYSPTLMESFGDILADMIGGVLFLFFRNL